MLETTTPTTIRPGGKGLPRGSLCTKRRPIPITVAEQRERSIIRNGRRGGGGTKWFSVHLTTSHSRDEYQLQQKQTNIGNAHVATNLEQHHPATQEERGFHDEYSFVATATKQDGKTTGGTQGEQLYMFRTPAFEHKNDINGPSIATVGLIGQTLDD